ncbi:MAG: hypothetical protein AAF986_06495, partial [Pseudomonadota bacterium]
ALLVAAGPEFAERGGLAGQRNLSYILPVVPRGEAQSTPFVPTRSDIGNRHPVTRELIEPADWGRWLRYLPGAHRRGEVLLTATTDAPLLVVDRVKEGRIGVLLSDHAWLWARGFDGGGPHQELLRRLVHWLMQEPELEEESLRGTVDSKGTLRMIRRTLAPEVTDVQLTDPNGQTITVPLQQRGPGLFIAEQAAPLPGLYRLETKTADGETLYALATSDESPVVELGAVETTVDVLSPLSDATGGGVFVMEHQNAPLPDLRRVKIDDAKSGDRWAGLQRRDIKAVEAVRLRPLMPPWAWLSLIMGLIVLAWLAEGGKLRGEGK